MQNKAARGDHITISVITYSELLLGAESYAKLQAGLFNKGTPIGPNDTMIADHALSLNAILVTNNLKHFKKVPRLKVENWVVVGN